MNVTLQIEDNDIGFKLEQSKKSFSMETSEDVMKHDVSCEEKQGYDITTEINEKVWNYSFTSGGGDIDPYTGEYDVEPDFIAQELPTKQKYMSDNVRVAAIGVSYTSNIGGGNTVYIGGNI